MYRYLFILLALVFLLPVKVYATVSTSDVTVYINLLAESCRINENQPVKAEFGTIQTNNLSAASADVPVTIACDDVPSGTISILLAGIVSDFNADAIQSNVAGLGITVKTEQGKVITPNKSYNVSEDLGLTSKTGSLRLKAGLISDGKTVLPGGEFNASATLVLIVS